MAESLVLVDEGARERFEFPVNPEIIAVMDGREFVDVPLVGLPTVLLAGSLRPIELSWESFFPRVYDASYCNYRNIERPRDSVQRIQRWMGRRGLRQVEPTPLRTIITGSGFSQQMVISDFTTEWRGGEPGDRYFSITMRQHRRQTVQIEVAGSGLGGVDLDPDTWRGQHNGGKRDTPTPPAGDRHHTVRSGDTLWKIAQKYYGNGDQWPKIYEANRSVIGSNPNLIKVGQTLVIPS